MVPAGLHSFTYEGYDAGIQRMNQHQLSQSEATTIIIFVFFESEHSTQQTVSPSTERFKILHNC